MLATIKSGRPARTETGPGKFLTVPAAGMPSYKRLPLESVTRTQLAPWNVNVICPAVAPEVDGVVGVAAGGFATKLAA